MNDAPWEIKSPALLNEFAEIMAFVRTSFQEERTAHEVETGVWQRIRKLGRSIFGAWLDLFGDGDAGNRIVLEDGRDVRRLVRSTNDRIRSTTQGRTVPNASTEYLTLSSEVRFK